MLFSKKKFIAPYLAGLIAIILAVYIIDYSASVLYPKAHRKWCKRRKERKKEERIDIKKELKNRSQD